MIFYESNFSKQVLLVGCNMNFIVFHRFIVKDFYTNKENSCPKLSWSFHPVCFSLPVALDQKVQSSSSTAGSVSMLAVIVAFLEVTPGEAHQTPSQIDSINEHQLNSTVSRDPSKPNEPVMKSQSISWQDFCLCCVASAEPRLRTPRHRAPSAESPFGRRGSWQLVLVTLQHRAAQGRRRGVNAHLFQSVQSSASEFRNKLDSRT